MGRRSSPRPGNEPWGMRGFSIRTPDGHQIRFGEPIKELPRPADAFTELPAHFQRIPAELFEARPALEHF